MAAAAATPPTFFRNALRRIFDSNDFSELLLVLLDFSFNSSTVGVMTSPGSAPCPLRKWVAAIGDWVSFAKRPGFGPKPGTKVAGRPGKIEKVNFERRWPMSGRDPDTLD
jgi:hypothetical protein